MKAGGSGERRGDLKEKFVHVPLSNPHPQLFPRVTLSHIHPACLDEVWMPQESKRRDVGSSVMGEGEAIRSEEICKF
ncbi:unnamed protein product [Tetraodon nigroviridis]|uniref:(spotted green pufferfish) hypothetical protein n=1 Tax=Tetraodon nigroviridis TaxID=99883 RepID=Q4RCG8_TETNG|nr:unnamed protein product [Tetraodon nigroviridis]